MRAVHRVTVDRQSFSARTGDVLLDAAMASGLDLPHYCRSGQCGTCRVSVVSGSVFHDREIVSGEVQACQARIVSDVEVVASPVPDSVRGSARVTAVRHLCPDVVEVALRPEGPMVVLPGQFVDVAFRGYPNRSFSPAPPVDEGASPDEIVLHVRRHPAGQVSAHLGTGIAAGHRATVSGPFGAAYLRPGQGSRLVLVAGGTGFAPIWAIVCAALLERPDRPIVLVVGFRRDEFYMAAALRRLMGFPNVDITAVINEASEGATGRVRFGHPEQHLPALGPDDVVHVAGSPRLVTAVVDAARTAGCPVHADTFVPSGRQAPGWRRQVASWLRLPSFPTARGDGPRP
jgi:3-phenylpropionate/trans-cinnamate dioxygenase ferredoxin reductase subunit